MSIDAVLIFQLNGNSLLGVSHGEAKHALKQLYAICRLTVYRERNDEQAALDQQEGRSITGNITLGGYHWEEKQGG